MTRRTKLELEINKPVTVELLFDEPITGESQFGSYAMYAVSVNEMEYSFFAPSEVHSELIKLNKGDKATITKLATQKGGNKVVTVYDVQVPNKAKVIKKAKVASIGEVMEEVVPKPNKEKAAIESHDKYYEIMKQSYSDALQINSELNGITADVVRLAITLFIQRAKTH